MTPRSYIYPPSSLPQTPSILSRSSSEIRINSKTDSLQDTPPSSNDSTQSTTSISKPEVKAYKPRDRSDWITRTVSALALNSLEEKGQGWIAARDSSHEVNNYHHGGSDSEDVNEGVEVEADGRLASTYHSALQTPASGYLSTSALLDLKPLSNPGKRNMQPDASVPDFVNARDRDEYAKVKKEDTHGAGPALDKASVGNVDGWIYRAIGWFKDQDDNCDDNVIDEHYLDFVLPVAPTGDAGFMANGM